MCKTPPQYVILSEAKDLKGKDEVKEKQPTAVIALRFFGRMRSLRMTGAGGVFIYYVYILTNKGHSVLYIGVTNNLQRRIYEHKNHLIPGFSARYNTDRLVYFECGSDVREAILREKQLKGWTRKRKEELINSVNPEWRDLSIEMELV